MPQALGILAAKAIAVATSKAFIYATLRQIGTTILISAVTKKLSSRNSNSRSSVSLAPRSITTSSATQPRELVYGDCTKTGHMFYRQVGGGNNVYLYEMHAFAAHEIDQFTHLYLEKYPDIDLLSDIDGSGFCTLPDYIDGDGVKLLRIQLFTGALDQPPDLLAASELAEWTVSHRAKGVAYVSLRLQQDASRFGADPESPTKNVWRNGNPTTVQARMKGAKVYDPREPLHEPNVTSTWEYSDNPALCLFDYLKEHPTANVPGRFGEDRERIPESFVSAAADICDQTVTVPDGDGGTVTQKRYRMALSAPLDSEPSAIVESMTQAMLGAVVYVSGTYEIRAGSYTTPAAEITGDWLSGGFSRQFGYGRADKFNTLRSLYFAPDDGRQLVDAPILANGPYITQDGGAITREVSFSSVRDVYQVQRIGSILLRGSRLGDQIELTCNLRALNLKVFDYITVDLGAYGLDGGLYQIRQWSLDVQDGALVVRLVCAESDASLYDVSISELNDSLEIQQPASVAESPPPVTDASASGGQGQSVVEWVNPIYPRRLHTELYSSATNDRATATLRTSEVGQSFSEILPDDETRFYWLIVRSISGDVSTWFPVEADGGLVATTATPPMGGSTVTVSRDFASVGAVGINGTLTSNKCSATATGGMSPYTFLWEYVSGDTSVTVNTSSVDNTTWTASGTDEVKTSIWRCKVTDTASAIGYSPTVRVRFVFGNGS